MKYPHVTSATIITTNKCTASCQECCFQCNPNNNKILTYKDIEYFINNAIKAFPALKLIVFTGGECTILGYDLIKSIKFAKLNNLDTRVVTNGWRARTKNDAKSYINELINAGLDELNFSTGDNHQKYIPFQNIINAAEYSCKNNLSTLISIESFNESKFNKNKALENKDFKNLADKYLYNNLNILESVWIPFHENTNYTYSYLQDENKGCDSILSYIGLSSDKKLYACCGLSVDYLESMKLGELYKDSLERVYFEQLEDFLKIWLYVDGPKQIYQYCVQKNPQIRPITMLTHICEYCLEIYTNKDCKNVIEETWKEQIESVMFRYSLMMNVENVVES